MGKFQNWWNNVKKVIGNISAFILAIITLIGAYHGVNWFIDYKIQKAVNSDEFIKKVQKGVRPFLIFDAKGSVLMDLGALEYINAPDVTSRDGSPIPEKVIVTPKAHMVAAPLITGIDQVGAVANPMRGQGLTWEYTFEATYVMTGDLDPETQVQKRRRFRLEIMK